MKLQKKKKGPFNSKTLEQKKFEHYDYSLISKIASEVGVTVTRVKTVYKLVTFGGKRAELPLTESTPF